MGRRREQIIDDGREFWAQHQFQVLGVLAATAAAAGFYGFYLHLRPARLDLAQVLRLSYLTAQLFVLESNLDATEQVNGWLTYARVAAPLIAGYAAWRGVAVLFREQLLLLALRLWRGHVVVVGLGARGLQLVRAYLARGERVAVVEADAENDEVPACRTQSVPVVIGNGGDPAVLQRARAHRARCVFAFTGKDDVNIEIAAAAYRLAGRHLRSGSRPLRFYVHLTDSRLTEYVRHHSLFVDPGDRFDARIVCVNDIAARLLFMEHPLDYAPLGERLRVRLLVAGFGRMGESVVLQAAKIGHFAGQRRVDITVVDHRAAAKEETLLGTYPQIRKATDLTFITMDLQSAAFLRLAVQWMSAPDALSTVVVCVNDPAMALSCALALAPLAHERSVPLHVRFDTEGGLASVLQTVGPGTCGPILPFGMLEKTCTPELIEDRLLDRMARAIHEAYVEYRRSCGTGRSDDPALAPWERLDRSLRDSNRQQADHIPVKLRALGLTTGQADPLRAGERVSGFSEEQLRLLSIMEHDRWNAERFLAGWRPGPVHDVARRQSPYLVSWEELPAHIQAYDRQAVENIPRLLERTGTWIYRASDNPSSAACSPPA